MTGVQTCALPISAGSQPSPIRLPLPCAWGDNTPKATGLLLLLCPTQLPRPIASLAPVRTEGPFGPVQSWTPSPEPAGLSPGGQVSDGSLTQAAPRPPFYAPPPPPKGCSSPSLSAGGSSGHPRPQPGHLSPCFGAAPLGPLGPESLQHMCSSPPASSITSPFSFSLPQACSPGPGVYSCKTHTDRKSTRLNSSH